MYNEGQTKKYKLKTIIPGSAFIYYNPKEKGKSDAAGILKHASQQKKGIFFTTKASNKQHYFSNLDIWILHKSHQMYKKR